MAWRNFLLPRTTQMEPMQKYLPTHRSNYKRLCSHYVPYCLRYLNATTATTLYLATSVSPLASAHQQLGDPLEQVGRLLGFQQPFTIGCMHIVVELPT